MTKQPAWTLTKPYGHAAAVESAGSVASPLLAGFSLTLIGIVASSKTFRLPDVALILLVLALASLVASIQCAFLARRSLVTPGELMEWYPRLLEDEKLLARAVSDQQNATADHRLWANRFAYLYNAGILLLLASIPVLLVPRNRIDATRWVAIGLAIGAFLAEVAWVSTRAQSRPAGDHVVGAKEAPRQDPQSV